VKGAISTLQLVQVANWPNNMMVYFSRKAKIGQGRAAYQTIGLILQ
jgi:hypothetical protein